MDAAIHFQQLEECAVRRFGERTSFFSTLQSLPHALQREAITVYALSSPLASRSHAFSGEEKAWGIAKRDLFHVNQIAGFEKRDVLRVTPPTRLV